MTATPLMIDVNGVFFFAVKNQQLRINAFTLANHKKQTRHSYRCRVCFL